MTPDELADRLERAADKVGPAVQKRMKHVATIGIAHIRRNASGRPGPRAITGAYRASWTAEHRQIPHGAECTIGTTKPQGRRLEFGFWDMTDSIGRHFFQPPYPHVQPALPLIGTILRNQMGEAIDEVLS